MRPTRTPARFSCTVRTWCTSCLALKTRSEHPRLPVLTVALLAAAMGRGRGAAGIRGPDLVDLRDPVTAPGRRRGPLERVDAHRCGRASPSATRSTRRTRRSPSWNGGTGRAGRSSPALPGAARAFLFGVSCATPRSSPPWERDSRPRDRRARRALERCAGACSPGARGRCADHHPRSPTWRGGVPVGDDVHRNGLRGQPRGRRGGDPRRPVDGGRGMGDPADGTGRRGAFCRRVAPVGRRLHGSGAFSPPTPGRAPSWPSMDAGSLAQRAHPDAAGRHPVSYPASRVRCARSAPPSGTSISRAST